MSASSSSSNSVLSSSTTIIPSTKQPQNPSEWQLYLVLQRANLLQYFDIFISQGGDDVQQLLEAGEEEFLEIMALVGMASKPLHVRRLQKALQEYTTNPSAFQLIAYRKCGVSPPPGVAVSAATGPLTQLFGAPSIVGPFSPGPSLIHHTALLGGHQTNATPLPLTISNSESPGALSSHSNGSANVWTQNLPENLEHGIEGYALPCTSPTLTEGQIQRISECALILARTLPDYEPKLVQNKKKISRELLAIMEMTSNNVGRLDEFRKYAAIYGRFDAKRKADKPLTLHEVSVNEAAAQICIHRPALLTRRDELFPLARQVVRDAGYHYVKQPGLNSRYMYRGDGDDYDRKRSSPAESIESIDGSPAPSTSTASEQSPDANGDNNSQLLNTPAKKKRRLDEIGEEMLRVSHEQDACKRRVAEAQDLSELHAIQRDLQRLTQRQLELSDEQAAILEALSTPPPPPVKISKLLDIGSSASTEITTCCSSSDLKIKQEIENSLATFSATPPNNCIP